MQVFRQCVRSNPADRPASTDLFIRLRNIAHAANLLARDSTAHYKQIKVDSVSCPILGPRAEVVLGMQRTSSQGSRWSSGRSQSSGDAAACAGVRHGCSCGLSMFPLECYSGRWSSRRSGSLASRCGQQARRGRRSTIHNPPAPGSTLLSSDSIPRGESYHLHVCSDAVSPTYSAGSSAAADHSPRMYSATNALAHTSDPSLPYASGHFRDGAAAGWPGAALGPRHDAAADAPRSSQLCGPHQMAQQQKCMQRSMHTAPPLQPHGPCVPAASSGDVPGAACGGVDLTCMENFKPQSSGCSSILTDCSRHGRTNQMHQLGLRGLSWAGEGQSLSVDATPGSTQGSALLPVHDVQSSQALVPTGMLGGSGGSGKVPRAHSNIHYRAVLRHAAMQLKDVDDAVSEASDTTSEDSRRGEDALQHCGEGLKDMDSRQKLLLAMDIEGSLPGRLWQQSSSVDSFNLDLGNSSNLQRLLQKQRRGERHGEGEHVPWGCSSEGSKFAVADARWVVGPMMPQEIVMNDPINAGLQTAQQPHCQSWQHMILESCGRDGLRTNSGAADRVPAFVKQADRRVSVPGHPSGDDTRNETMNAVALNPGAQDKLQHRQNHGSQRAADASHAADAEGKRHAQSIVQIVRRMALIATRTSTVTQRAIHTSSIASSGQLHRDAGAFSSAAVALGAGSSAHEANARHLLPPAGAAVGELLKSGACGDAAPPQLPPHASGAGEARDTAAGMRSLRRACARGSRSLETPSMVISVTPGAVRVPPAVPVASSSDPAASTGLQTCPGSTPPSSFPHSHSSIPACMSRQPHTVSRPILTPTTACPAQLVHATTSQPSLHPQHHQPEQPWLRPRHLLHVPGIQHAQHPSPAPLNACTLQSMRVLTDSRNASTASRSAMPSWSAPHAEAESAMKGVTAWLKDLQPDTPPPSPVRGTDSCGCRGSDPPPMSYSGAQSHTRHSSCGGVVVRGSQERRRGMDLAGFGNWAGP